MPQLPISSSRRPFQAELARFIKMMTAHYEMLNAVPTFIW